MKSQTDESQTSSKQKFTIFDDNDFVEKAGNFQQEPTNFSAQTPEQIRAKRTFDAKMFGRHFKFGTPDKVSSPYSKTRAGMRPQPGDLHWEYNNSFQKEGDMAHVPHASNRDAERPTVILDDSADIKAGDAPSTAPLTKRIQNVRKDLYSELVISDNSPAKSEISKSKVNKSYGGMGGKPQWTFGGDVTDVSGQMKKVDLASEGSERQPQRQYQSRVPSREFTSSWSFGGDVSNKEN